MDIQNQRFEVKGMHCGGCSGKIRTALHSVSGVQEASVSHETGGGDAHCLLEDGCSSLDQ